MTLLMIDYVFMNATPFTMRHILVLILLSVVYLLINFIWCETIGPVYPDMTWRGTKGLLRPPIIVLAGILIFLAFTFLTKVKLTMLGYGEFLETITQRKKIGGKYER